MTWFERGASALRKQIQALSETLDSRPLTRDQQEVVISEKRRKLADTLCAVTEVYMTDLSWEKDAEQRCETLITEATMLAPDVAETWQTVANVRISQARTDEAKEALKRSLGNAHIGDSLPRLGYVGCQHRCFCDERLTPLPSGHTGCTGQPPAVAL